MSTSEKPCPNLNSDRTAPWDQYKPRYFDVLALLHCFTAFASNYLPSTHNGSMCGLVSFASHDWTPGLRAIMGYDCD